MTSIVQRGGISSRSFGADVTSEIRFGDAVGPASVEQKDRKGRAFPLSCMISKGFSVAVMVSDAKKSAKWYKEKLGFSTSVEEHWVTAWPKGAAWKLHLCEGELEPGNTGIGLYAEDLEKTISALKKKGVKFSQDHAKTEWGELNMFDDPDGNVFWISQGGP
jgi:predicted enzyme related to lactoylglutathione lyase